MSEQVRILEGHLNVGHGGVYGIIVSRFNGFITERLLEGALDCFQRHGIENKGITIVRVPGAFEIPMALSRMAKTGQFAGIACLGAVIRGSTPHFDYVAAEVSKGVAAVAMEYGIPVGFGVLTTDTVEQAIDRAGTKAGNKGWETAQSLIEMVDLFTKI
ncbi:MAG: 6,7-dimethyl-8-ribityllumazine synthase [Magnetococcales bacterium]|nr:6,7-dimethyl-8-ribityllumazine synthase [Magnetococcales bacterium]MBF0149761.1 6,7-dimethyl-8-ribityllumazine synthase [Magnetococcales bacterium]